MGFLRKQKWTLLSVAVVMAWLIGAGVGGPYFGKISEVSELDLTSFLPKSSEAGEVAVVSQKYRDENLLPAVIVYEAKSGNITESQKAAVEVNSTRIGNIQGVSGDVSPPNVSEDGKAVLVVASLDDKIKIATTVGEINTALERNKIDGLTAHVGGPASFSAELSKAFGNIDGLLLAVALGVVFVILLIVYRSPLLPVMVLLSSTFALAVSILIVYWLAKADVVTINGQVQGILFILVIGAATDYSLLFVSRFREELYKTGLRRVAIARAWKASVEPIVASGSTVIAGLLCLLLSDLGSNKALGPAGSIGILMAMISALTLLPALLMLIGRKAFWPLIPRANEEALKSHEAKLKRGIWHKVGELVARYPRPVWAITTLILVAGAFGLIQLRADGVAQSDAIFGQSDARDAQDVISRHFPQGAGSPVVVVTAADKAETVAKELEKLTSIETTSVVAENSPSGTIPLGKDAESLEQTLRAGVAARLSPEAPKEMIDTVVRQMGPFAAATPKEVDGKVLVQAVLAAEPDSAEAKAAIPEVRKTVKSVDTTAKVGGPTAVQYDTNEASQRDREVIIPAILAAITIILMILLRSLAAPLMLLATTVLSFAFSLGISALVFTYVFKFPGSDPAVILYAFVFLVALGIDYNIFLMTRVREESLRLGTSKGVIKGLVTTGGVITSAGIVLAATFAALSVIPISFLLQIAFLVAFGVIIDTIIVRSLLVPALVRDIGSKIWWPVHKKFKD